MAHGLLSCFGLVCCRDPPPNRCRLRPWASTRLAACPPPPPRTRRIAPCAAACRATARGPWPATPARCLPACLAPLTAPPAIVQLTQLLSACLPAVLFVPPCLARSRRTCGSACCARTWGAGGTRRSTPSSTSTRPDTSSAWSSLQVGKEAQREAEGRLLHPSSRHQADDWEHGRTAPTQVLVLPACLPD